MKAFACTIAAMMASAVMAAPVSSLPSTTNLPAISGVPTASVSTVTSIATAAASTASSKTGQIVTDAGKPVQKLLSVTGQDAKQLLLQLSPEVTALLSGLGLPEVGVPVGAVIATASSLGDLVKDLGSDVEGLLTVVGTDGKFLLVQLGADVAALVSGLGLPSVGVPVGAIIATIGDHVRRDGIVDGAGSAVAGLLTVTGQDAKKLLIQLSPEVTALLSGLGLPAVGVVAGEVIASASSIGDLLTDIAPAVKGLLHIVSQDTGYLLIQLSDDVAGLLSGLGLPELGVPIGAVVSTLAESL